MTTIELTFHDVADATTGAALAAVVTLSRPEQLNPIDTEMLTDLDAALDEIEARREARTILVTGAGRAFSAGGDMKGYQTLQRDPVGFPRFVAHLHRVFSRLRRGRLPADRAGQRGRGGGRAGTDPQLRLRDRGARRAHRRRPPELRPDGRGRRTHAAASRRRQGARDGADAHRTPVERRRRPRAGASCQRVVDDDALLAAGLELSREIAAKSPLAVANAKQVMHRIWAENATVDDGLADELASDVEYCLTSYDAPEGLAAFAEKRAPRFEGR